MSLNIYIVRHGQDKDNKNRILNGHRDTSLTKTGIKQIKELAFNIRKENIKFDAIYSSPLNRAIKTAQIISSIIDGKKVEILDILIERNFGVLTGVKISEISTKCSSFLKTNTIAYFLSAEGAETFPEVIKRCNKVIKLIKEKHKNGNILLVTHGDVGKMIFAAFYKIQWKKTLKFFHFGNSEMVLLSEDLDPKNSKIFEAKQFNL